MKGWLFMNIDLNDKTERLITLLKTYGRVAIAFSGGVDSTYLASVAHEILDNDAVAITINSEAYPPDSIVETRKLADHIGIRLIEIPAQACDIQGFKKNEPDRCYHCKHELFSLMWARARDEGIHVLLDGTNADDTGDYRPGMKALEELNVKSPLRDAGFTKADIRAASRELGLSTWDRQSYACLASRFPYGQELTPELLEKAWRAESLLRELGIRAFRVRSHDTIARIEVDAEGMEIVMEPANRDRIVSHMKSLGYLYVALDLEGFRTGSMNDVLGET